LVDGTRTYLHAVLDDSSRRILAWRVAETFAPINSVAALLDASRAATSSGTSPVMWAAENTLTPAQLSEDTRSPEAVNVFTAKGDFPCLRQMILRELRKIELSASALSRSSRPMSITSETWPELGRHP
jgi:hypothetical protein